MHTIKKRSRYNVANYSTSALCRRSCELCQFWQPRTNSVLRPMCPLQPELLPWLGGVPQLQSLHSQAVDQFHLALHGFAHLSANCLHHVPRQRISNQIISWTGHHFWNPFPWKLGHSDRLCHLRLTPKIWCHLKALSLQFVNLTCSWTKFVNEIKILCYIACLIHPSNLFLDLKQRFSTCCGLEARGGYAGCQIRWYYSVLE